MKPNTFWSIYMLHATRALCVFPVLVLASFYGTWFAGRIVLGHWPRSSLDDPKNIAGLMWPYHSTAVLITVGLPLFCFAVVGLSLICFFKKPDGWKTRLMEIGGALLLFVGLILFSRWDPHSVIEWYFD